MPHLLHLSRTAFPLQFVATREVPLAGSQPVLLHGGGLLGAVLNKPAAGGSGGSWLQPALFAGVLLAQGECTP
jgi:hypothetical protein